MKSCLNVFIMKIRMYKKDLNIITYIINWCENIEGQHFSG